MAFGHLTVVLLSLILCVASNNGNVVSGNLHEQHLPKVGSLVDHLNGNPYRIYNFNRATLINAQNKDDFGTDLAIDVDVTCHNQQDDQCVAKSLRCQGSVRYDAERSLHEAMPGVICHVTKYNRVQSEEDSHEALAERTWAKNDMDNDIDVNYVYKRPVEVNSVDIETVPNYEKIADNGQVDDILRISGSLENPFFNEEAKVSTEVNVLTKEQMLAMDELSAMENEEPRKKRGANHDPTANKKDKSNGKYAAKLDKKKKLDDDDYKRPRRDASSESDEDNDVPRRRKRAVTSLEKISPQEKDLVKSLADLSVTNLDVIDEDNHKRVVLQVLGAKKMQVDSATVYHLTLRVGISHCHEDSGKSEDYCKERLIEHLTKICKVQVEVDGSSNNVLKSQCQNMKRDERDRNRTNKHGLLGGILELNPNDPETVKFAKDLIEELNTQHAYQHMTLISIESANRQVISGTVYKLQLVIEMNGKTRNCLFTVVNLVKEKGRTVTVKCGTSEKQYRLRRSTDSHGVYHRKIHLDMFKSFMDHHGKKYKSKAEYKKRFNIFKENMIFARYLNENEEGTAKYGATKFADLTQEEFKRYTGLDMSLKNENNVPLPKAVIPNVELPIEFDWRNKGAVSPVKNQGSCGSCWAFSVTGNIEGLNAISTGTMIELSEQELVDCDKLDSGCNGGLPDNAYRAIEELGGLETESEYPYEAEDEKCHFNPSLSKVQISGAVNISSNETDMAKWLVKNAPISIGINANAMQFYMGGISHPWKMLCNPNNLDHGVLIVGFGVHKYPLFNKTLPYWIVKNSWGASWGEQGYYRVYRGDGTCGLNNMASSAVL